MAGIIAEHDFGNCGGDGVAHTDTCHVPGSCVQSVLGLLHLKDIAGQGEYMGSCVDHIDNSGFRAASRG